MGDRGASAVEFAVLLPVLILILFGIVEFSLIMYDRIHIASAARELARYASVFTPPDLENPTDPRRSRDQIIEYAIERYDCLPPNCPCGNNDGDLDLSDFCNSSLGNRDFDPNDPGYLYVLPCPNVCDPDSDCFAEVGIAYTHDYLLFIPGAKALFPSSNWSEITLRALASMRCE